MTTGFIYEHQFGTVKFGLLLVDEATSFLNNVGSLALGCVRSFFYK